MERQPEIVDVILRWIGELFEALFSTIFVLIFSVVIGSILTLAYAVVRGIVIVFLWGWFVSPIFSIRPISLGEAAGLYLVVNALLPIHPTQGEKAKSRYAKKHPVLLAIIDFIAIMFLAPAFALCFGWLWHTYCTNISVPHALDFIRD